MLSRPIAEKPLPQLVNWANYLSTGFVTSIRHLVATGFFVILMFACHYSNNDVYEIESDQEEIRTDQEARRTLDFLEAFYFSTVTFATLGYGDVAPDLEHIAHKCKTTRCRLSLLLPATQAVFGAAFMALLVAVITRANLFPH